MYVRPLSLSGLLVQYLDLNLCLSIYLVGEAAHGHQDVRLELVTLHKPVETALVHLVALLVK